FASVMRSYLDFYVGRSYALKMSFEELSYFFGILIRNQTHRYFSVGFGRQYCFCPFADITAPHTIYLQGWPDAGTFNRRITFFSPNFIYTQIRFVCFYIKWSLIQGVS